MFAPCHWGQLALVIHADRQEYMIRGSGSKDGPEKSNDEIEDMMSVGIGGEDGELTASKNLIAPLSIWTWGNRPGS